MTVTFDHHGNGATDEADVNNTDTGFGSTWNSVSKTGALTIKYDTAHAIHSTTSIRQTRPSSSDNGYCLAQPATAVARLQATAYVWMDALPAAQLNLYIFRNAGFAGYIALNPVGVTAGRLTILNASGTAIVASAATADFPVGQWVRVEAAFTKGTTTSNGKAEYAYYIGDATSAVYTYDTGATINTGTTDYTGCRFGISGVTTTPPSVWYGRPRLGDAASGFLGPITTTADRDWMTWDGSAWV